MSGFDTQPTLEGQRVLIRPLRETDWEPMFRAAADPKIWEQHPESNRYTEAVFRRFFDGALQSRSAFAFVDLGTSKVIGSSRYHGHDPGAKEIEIGWSFLARQYWGGPTNAEIKSLMLGHAFQFVDTVVFWVGETNWRSRKAMEKIGAILRPGRIHRPGEDPNSPFHVVYEIRKSDFDPSVMTGE